MIAIVFLPGCQPSDRTPGLWLRGEAASEFPGDWTFSDAHNEVYLQVVTPYFLPHSVTIWCAQVDGQLFIGARNPDAKNWPGWVDKNQFVTLKIVDALYLASLQNVQDTNKIDLIKNAYKEKYHLKTSPGEASPPMRYWQVLERSPSAS